MRMVKLMFLGLGPGSKVSSWYPLTAQVSPSAVRTEPLTVLVTYGGALLVNSTWNLNVPVPTATGSGSVISPAQHWSANSGNGSPPAS